MLDGLPEKPTELPTVLTKELKDILYQILSLREKEREAKHYQVTDKIRSELSKFWNFEICDKRKEWLFCGGEKEKGSFASLCNEQPREPRKVQQAREARERLEMMGNVPPPPPGLPHLVGEKFDKIEKTI